MRKDLLRLGVAVGFFCAVLSPAVDFSSWQKELSIQFTGYTPPETLTNFPVLVILGSNVNGFAYGQFLSGTHNDLRFADASGTNELNYEVDQWNTNGLSYVWVQVPRLADTNTSIWAFWGMSGQSAPACTTNGLVWSAGYVGVWHLSQSNGVDSTANAFNGTPTGNTNAVGYVGGGQAFDNSGARIDLPATLSARVTNAVTFEGWAYMKSYVANTYPAVVTEDYAPDNTDVQFALGVWNSGNLFAGYYPGAWPIQESGALPAQKWYHVAGTFDGQHFVRVYRNGQQTAVSGDLNHALLAGGSAWRIGCRWDVLDNWNGYLDEVRVSNVARSPTWIWATWMNTASNAVFEASPLGVQIGGAPAVMNLPATNVTATSATLNGYLSSTGLAATAVTLYWGTNDGEDEVANWGNTNDLGFTDPGPLSVDVSPLSPNAVYFYRYCATNDHGAVWADSTEVFLTGAFTVQATDPSAWKSGPDTGTFTLYRPDWSTGAALTVSYTLAGTASNGVDYVALPGQATFAVGATNATVTVTPLADGIPQEGYRTVILTLSGDNGILGDPSNATVTIQDGTWYVATNGDDSAGGTNWATAFASVSNGIAHALPGDVVLVSNGTYTISPELVISNAISLVSVAGATNTLLKGVYPAAGRVLVLTNSPALLVDGFTVTNAGFYAGGVHIGGGVLMYAGTLRNCVIANCTAGGGDHAYGGGIYVAGGLISNCIIRANFSEGGHLRVGYGGGVFLANGTIVDSRFERNLAKGSPTGWGGTCVGGGIYQAGGTVVNCLFTSNRVQRTTNNGNGDWTSSWGYGGGAYVAGGALLNCTLVDNVAVSNNPSGGVGAGVYQAGGGVTNVIAYFNLCAGVANDFFAGGGTVVYSCAPELTSGTGNRSDDPLFVAHAALDCHLTKPSPCVDTGSTVPALANDLDGNPRPVDGDKTGGAQYDMGCYEFQGGVYACDFATTNARIGVNALSNVIFTASVDGPANATNIVYYWWDFGVGTPPQSGPGLVVVTNTFAWGKYDVSLTVSNSLGQTASAVKPVYIQVTADQAYVSTNAASSYPYQSWANAATNVSDALDAVRQAMNNGAVNGAVWVTDGVYAASAELVVDGPIAVRSLNGASNTVVYRRAGPVFRIFTLNHAAALVDGLTITNGSTGATSVEAGGGVKVASGTLRNCIVMKNSIFTPGNGQPAAGGGGVYLGSGLVSNCVIRGNTSYGGYFGDGYAGGLKVAGGTATWCVVDANWCYGLQAIYGGIAYGGGVSMSGGLLSYTVVTSNTCESTGSGTEQGGGVYLTGGLVRNCLVAQNVAKGVGASAPRGGGGIYMAGGAPMVESTTVADNTCATNTAVGGGIYIGAGAVTNTIVFANQIAGVASNVTGSAAAYSCAPELTTGTGNITSDPLFKRRGAFPYAIHPMSPCVDRGTNLTWMTNASDLAGAARLFHVRVDMGAYEALVPPAGAFFIVR